MKVYISADMVGATGVTGWKDVTPGEPSYERFRKLLTRDVNAAIEGAIQGGATQIVVNEAHGSKKNILIEELHADAEMISGPTQFLGMMEGISDEFDCAFFIGYHARAGTQEAVLNHTMSSSQIFNIKLNGTLIGELGINARIAGYFGVPVVLVTGDNKIGSEAKELLGNIETVQVKEAIDKYVAKCLTPTKTSNLIRKTAKKAIENLNQYKVLKTTSPIEGEIEFKTTAKAASAALVPTVERKGSRSISYICEDIISFYRLIKVCLIVANRDEKV